MVIAALFIIAKIRRQPKCPSVDEWIKMSLSLTHSHTHSHTHTHIYSELPLIHKKERNFSICNNMDRLEEYYAKWKKSDRERQILYDITYMWNIKNSTNRSVTITNTTNTTWKSLSKWAILIPGLKGKAGLVLSTWSIQFQYRILEIKTEILWGTVCWP